MGDFNIDLFKNNELVIDYTAHIYSLRMNFLTQSLPTRVTDSSSSLIDHFSCSFLMKNCKLFNITDDLSDHDLLLVNIELSHRKHVQTVIKARTLLNYHLPSEYFSVFPFSVQGEDVDKSTPPNENPPTAKC